MVNTWGNSTVRREFFSIWKAADITYPVEDGESKNITNTGDGFWEVEGVILFSFFWYPVICAIGLMG